MDPIKVLQAGKSVIFPNNRSKTFWVDKLFKTGDAAVLSGYSALTFQELLVLFCEQSPEYFSKRLLTDAEAFLYHSYHIKKFFEKSEYTLDVTLTISAINLIFQWRVSQDQLRYFSTLPKEESFYNYFSYYLKIKSDKTNLFELVAETLKQPGIKLPISSLFFWGIDDLTPLQDNFISYLKNDHHVEMESYHYNAPNRCEKMVFKTPQDELHAAMAWLQNQDHNHHQVSAIVIPTLTSDYSLLHSQLQKFFSPVHARLPLESVSQNFVISHGFKVIEYPLVSHTLMWLECQQHSCSYLPCLDLGVHLFSSSSNKTFAKWVEKILLSLQENNWCEALQLSSVEYQVRDFFLNCLKSFIPISESLGPVSFIFFKSCLKNYLAKTIFQPESPRKKSKLVLGLLEAAALPLDSIFLTNTSEQQLLHQSTPHSYISYTLAQSLCMPHSSWEREVSYLSRMIARLIDNKNTIISFARSVNSQVQAHSSSLIDNLTPSLSSYLEKYNSTTIDNYKPLKDYSPSNQAVWETSAWSLSEINAYYKCPFLGFAKKFGIEGIERRNVALLTPKEQGSFYHEYLSNLIDGKSHQDPLAIISHLPSVIQECEINKAQRVFNQVAATLDLNQYKSESSWSESLGGLQLRGRYDLVSLDGTTVVDFKSKSFNFSSWFSHTPSDLQGAIYAVISNAHTLGVVKAWPGGSKVRIEKTSTYIDSWHEQVNQLINSVKSASCLPAPRNKADCRNCQFKQGCKYDYY